MTRLCWLFSLIFCLLIIAEKAWGSPIPKDTPLLLLDLFCNGESAHQIVYAFRDKNNQMWLREDAFKACQIMPNNKEGQAFGNDWYYPLENAKWVTYLYDPNQLRLDLLFPSSLLPKQTTILNQPNDRAIRPQHPGAYINYDGSFQKNNVNHQTHLGLLTDFVYFNRFGVGDLNVLFQNGDINQKVVRLTSTWTLDQPEKMATWRVGDSISGTAIWSGAVQFGGIQYSTNFATQPGFVPFPLPAFIGQAVIPTTVNFYLDNQLTTSQQVATGPFEIEGLPVVTGAGDLVVQSKDILGRQSVTILPFYASPEFLEPGLESFSYEMGMIRTNFGIESNDYSQFILVGSYQKGLSNLWTAGWHGELLRDQQTFGINTNHILKQWLELDLAIAGSHSANGIGGLFLTGVQRRTKDYNLGLQLTSSSKYFQQLGIQQNGLAPKQMLQANAGYLLADLGAMGISYTDRIGSTEPSINMTTLSYSRSFYKALSFIISYIHQSGCYRNDSVYISLIWSPKPDMTVAAGYQQDSQQKGAALSISKNLPTDSGYGYRLLSVAGVNTHLEADFLAQNDYGFYQLMLSHIDNTDNLEVDIAGSMVYFVNEFFLTRKVENSFIVVEVPKMKNVPIYNSNQLITKTNKKGFAFLPQALPYDDNVISIHPSELPLNTKIEKTNLHVSPYYRSGAFLQFPVAWSRQFSFNLVTPQGDKVPTGAVITLMQGQQYPVGYDGKVFIFDAPEEAILSGIAKWGTKSCRFSSPWQEHGEAIIDLGTLTCG